MSELENISAVMVKSLQSYSANFRKKILSHTIFTCWKEIAAPLAEDIFPIKVENQTIILYAKNTAAKDNFKYIAKDILDAANKIVGGGEEVYKKFDYAKNFDKPNRTAEKILSKKKFSAAKKISVADVKLTAAEIAECEKNVAEIKNPEIKKIALASFITQKKSYKLKIKSGWHKCKICESLCPPEEIICEVCRISERDKMRRTIRQIFLKNPCAKFFDVLNEVKKIFPHLAEEIFISTVTSERSALIKSFASKISFSDTKSEDAKFLVQLYKQLPKDKLTDAIIKRAFNELRFNLINGFDKEKIS